MKTRSLSSTLLLLAGLASEASAATYYVNVNSTNPVSPYRTWDTSATNIQDAAGLAAHSGDIILVTNGVYRSGGYTNGSYTARVALYNLHVALQSVNGPLVTVIEGAQTPGTINGPGALACVTGLAGCSVIGFTLTNGATTSYGGGVYGTGTTVSNCIIVGNFAFSGGGAAFGTLYNCAISNNSASYSGGGAYSATLYNCTVSSNSAQHWGGGADQATLVNCMIISNAATSSGGTGGGAYECQLDNCCIYGNSATFQGGGAKSVDGSIRNCTFAGNSAASGGGVYWIIAARPIGATNLVIFDNSATDGPNYVTGVTLVSCCTTPLSAWTVNCFTNDPLFVDPASGNFRLQSSSPCINAGNNLAVTNALDLDGNPRIVAGSVDIGAYEFQNPTSVISYAWLQQYGLPTDGSADSIDSDGDGMNNWQEWICGTDPTNPISVLRMLSPSNSVPGMVVGWQSVTNRTYYLQRSTNLAAWPGFVTIRSNILGQVGTTGVVDTNATGSGPFFYRVGIPQ